AMARASSSRGCANKRTRSIGRMAKADAIDCRSVRRFMAGMIVANLRYSEAMGLEWIFGAWGRILNGYTPALSIEITRECPLRCPGCYAYGDDHLGGELTLREVRDYKGQELIDRFLEVVDRH